MKVRTLATNPQALRQRRMAAPLEAGLVLTGAEVKSLRAGRVSLAGSFVRIRKGEAYLDNAFIALYQKANQVGYDPRRSRKLLLKKNEIGALLQRLGKGLTIVPLRVYTNPRGLIKASIVLTRGKRKADKRAKKKKKELGRDIQHVMGMYCFDVGAF